MLLKLNEYTKRGISERRVFLFLLCRFPLGYLTWNIITRNKSDNYLKQFISTIALSCIIAIMPILNGCGSPQSSSVNPTSSTPSAPAIGAKSEQSSSGNNSPSTDAKSTLPEKTQTTTGTTKASTDASTATAPAPTSVAKPEPIPAPTPQPAPAPKPQATVTIISVSSPAARNSEATLVAKVAQGANASIEVDYKSGPSQAQGLEDKTMGT